MAKGMPPGKKFTTKTDDAWDKKRGVKEDSKKDKGIDKRRGVK